MLAMGGTANAQPKIVGTSATYWTATDSVEITLWLTGIPETPMPISVYGYQFDRYPDKLYGYNALNDNSAGHIFLSNETFYFDEQFDILGTIATGGSQLVIREHDVIEHSWDYWHYSGDVQTFPVVDYTFYTLDTYPHEIPVPKPQQLRVMRGYYGGAPQAAWVANIPFEHLGFTKAEFLYSGGLYYKSFVDERRTIFVPEPAATVIVVSAILPSLMILLRRCRPRLRHCCGERCVGRELD